MANVSRYIGYSSLICLVFTCIWLVLFIINSYDQITITQIEDVRSNLENIRWTFYAAYINAGLLTLIIPAFMLGLYFKHKEKFPFASLLSLLYVPVYIGLNIFSYFSQPAFIPGIMAKLAHNNHDVFLNEQLGLFAHVWPFSLITFTNSLAYAVIGVPSIIFGIINLRENPTLRLGGTLLGMSGLASIVGFSGLMISKRHLNNGTVWGGILFLVSLILFTYFYLFAKKTANNVSGN